MSFFKRFLSNLVGIPTIFLLMILIVLVVSYVWVGWMVVILSFVAGYYKEGWTFLAIWMVCTAIYVTVKEEL